MNLQEILTSLNPRQFARDRSVINGFREVVDKTLILKGAEEGSEALEQLHSVIMRRNKIRIRVLAILLGAGLSAALGVKYISEQEELPPSQIQLPHKDTTIS